MLLIPLVNFLPATDHRVRKTVGTIADELTYHGFVLRRRPADPEADVAGETFVVCTLWLVSALAAIGEGARARALCERMLAGTSPLGLYAEHVDPRSGRHMGNFPHAFTHMMLVNAIMSVLEEPA